MSIIDRFLFFFQFRIDRNKNESKRSKCQKRLFRELILKSKLCIHNFRRKIFSEIKAKALNIFVKTYSQNISSQNC